jgi:putative transposase
MKPDPARPRPCPEASLNRAFYLPRLDRSFYQGDAVVHWSLPVARRGTGWLTDAFHARFCELMLHAAAREGLACPTYCLMPDHLHLVWMGLRRDTDQRNGMAFLRTHLEPALAPHRFQHQRHDHVLREAERQRGAFASACSYDLDNPRRGGLVEHPRQWPYLGTAVLGYPALHPLAEDFWETFWRLYAKLKLPDAHHVKRGPDLRSSRRKEAQIE